MTVPPKEDAMAATTLLARSIREIGTTLPVDVMHVSGTVRPGGIALVAAAVGSHGPANEIRDMLVAAVDASLDSLPPGAHMINTIRSATDADGFVLVVDGDAVAGRIELAWSGLEMLCEAGDIDGRPVGLAAVGNDVHRCGEVLAEVRSMVVNARGLPVGAGLIVDAADGASVSRTPTGRPELNDITTVSQLTLLGRRVEKLAAARLSLRRR